MTNSALNSYMPITVSFIILFSSTSNPMKHGCCYYIRVQMRKLRLGTIHKLDNIKRKQQVYWVVHILCFITLIKWGKYVIYGCSVTLISMCV